MDLIFDHDKSSTLLPRVMRAAVALFVKQGVEATTIKDIADAAGVSAGALYNHFKGKHELAWALFSTHLQAFTEKLSKQLAEGKNSEEKVRLYVEACFNAFDSNPDLFTYLIVAETREFKKYPSDLAHPGTIANQIIEEGQKNGDIKEGPVRILGALLFGGVIRVCTARMYGGFTEDLRTQIPLVSQSLWQSLRS
ncbi:MAG: TetR/AcrR family transcriptional regulator [Elusimicrobia bacterium]|jgi:AcrR family transcriptional regulator|nr:TetR/AcrR family transcriptional regulator [Elusimicrobiota bacterium]